MERASSSTNPVHMREFDYNSFLDSALSEKDVSSRGSVAVSVTRLNSVAGVGRRKGSTTAAWMSAIGDVRVKVTKTVNGVVTENSDVVQCSYETMDAKLALPQQSRFEVEDEVEVYQQRNFRTKRGSGMRDSRFTIDEDDASSEASSNSSVDSSDDEGNSFSTMRRKTKLLLDSDDSASTCSGSPDSSEDEEEGLPELHMKLNDMPMSPAMYPVITAWVAGATKALMQATAPLLTAASSLPIKVGCMGPGAGGSAGKLIGANGMPLKMSSIGSGPVAFLKEAAEEIGHLNKAAAQHVGLLSLTSAVMFIGSIRGLNSHRTAKQGNYMGMMATAVGLLSVLASAGFDQHTRFIASFLLAAGVGYTVAETVQMEDMPQLVAGFHSFVGLAAVLVGFASHFGAGAAAGAVFLKAAETFVGTAIGSLTFTGSVVAAGKLHGSIPGAPYISPYRWPLNFSCLLASMLLGHIYCHPAAAATSTAALLANTAIWGVLGVNMVMPVGGADMPIIVSMLNSFSGIATAASGFMLGNDLLTITGALVTSSGALLSEIMCKGINRSLANVLLGGFGTDGGVAVASSSASHGGVHTEISHQACSELFLGAKKILIVPGYGLAVARCQQKLAETVEFLRSHGKTVHFAIHPVAGRLPGHMNVLLAEASVPYEIVKEMDEINSHITSYDVAIVIGANDIVNPATQTDPSSPIYGMPAIEVWKCNKCIVLKRSMATGYSGVDNPLFYLANVRMLFGDAKNSVDSLSTFIHESADRITGSPGDGDEDEEEEFVAKEEENYPEAVKSLGVMSETDPASGEKRVALTPGVVGKMRKQGYSIVFESGAGMAAGFPDAAYLEKGGITVVGSKSEVMQNSDIILKVSPPTEQELKDLGTEKTFISIWSMFGNETLLETVRETWPNTPTVFNMALIPRISRAQALDVLTSMANIAGYRAVLDAFSHYSKFPQPSVTASGNTPPAKVFIVGAGVAGLSAISTANALGAKVYASDVRSAAKEQVESLGAEFVSVDESLMIKGEGSGGYAKEMGDDFKEAQKAMYSKMCTTCDVVICTALIPNRPAPVVITEDMVLKMKQGSVIVDLAAANGGNCELTVKDDTITSPDDGHGKGGVTIIGKTNYPSEMATQASEFLARNFVAFLEVVGGGEQDMKELNLDDPIIRDSMVTYSQQGVMYPPPPKPKEVTISPAAPEVRVVDNAPNTTQEVTPEAVSWLISWLNEHKEELAMGLGLGICLTLGLGFDIPQEEITHLGYFALSLLIGHFTVASVTPALHTPLISVTNAISGIIVIGGMLQLSGSLATPQVICALLSIFFSSVNIVGGFAVTARMLEMFKSDAEDKAHAH